MLGFNVRARVRFRLLFIVRCFEGDGDGDCFRV